MILSALTTKLFRDLGRCAAKGAGDCDHGHRGQRHRTCFVGCRLSIANRVQVTQATFYNDYRFAEVFVSLKQAPEGLVDAHAARSRAWSKCEPRVMFAAVNLDIEDVPRSG